MSDPSMNASVAAEKQIRAILEGFPHHRKMAILATVSVTVATLNGDLDTARGVGDWLRKFHNAQLGALGEIREWVRREVSGG